VPPYRPGQFYQNELPPLRPLFVTATGMPSAAAADLVRRMAGRHRLPDALRRADILARAGPPTATMTDREPD
jgi:endonuclease V-like protein UPF0215 family